MTATFSYSLPRFGQIPSPQTNSSQNRPTVDATDSNRPASGTPETDRVELHRAQSPQHTPLLQHDLLKLQGRLQLFAKRIGKAFHGLVSDQEPNPHLKLALKRFSKATQNLAQSPALSAAFREHFIKMNEALIAASELSDTDKQEAVADLHRNITPEVAKQVGPQAFSAMLNDISEVAESGHLDTAMPTGFAMFSEMMVQSLAQQQQPEEPEPEKAGSIREAVKKAKDEGKSDIEIAKMVQSQFFTPAAGKDKKKDK
ncbi:MAG: hypothetical protein K0Q50_179 [Vampirovibrio sp.]|jgi:hypothetical protein|nr:hypothetical protein [Vampirovibrio sp.]